MEIRREITAAKKEK